MEKTITLIRHGETAGNLGKRYIGITNEPLCPEGKEEIRRRRYPRADLVFSSPMIRCEATAKLIYPGHQIIIVDGFRETDFGLFEGKNYKDLAEDPAYQSWIDSGGKAAFPGGESRRDAVERTMAGFAEMLEYSRDAAEVSVILHGGSIMGILSHLFGGEYYSYHVENGEGYTFDLSYNGVCGGLCFRSFLG
ncbi:MAG: histidine phosphatase family protein [Lachnospiraceae bacterium]|nr:histidine phosphatase family protein [Lachnospiraceae bacterium]